MSGDGERKIIKCNSENEMIKNLCSFVASEIRSSIKDNQSARIGVSGLYKCLKPILTFLKLMLFL